MKKTILICAMLPFLLLTGCKDYLLQEPITSQATDQLLSDYNGLNNATFGAYARLANNNWYGGTYFLLDADTRAGVASWPVSSNFQSGRMMTGFAMNYNENSTSGLWTNAYFVIAAANNVLESIESIGPELVSSIVTQQDLDNLKAECLFLRALSHFDLIRIYSSNANPELGVPVILKTDRSSTEQPSRNTLREVYDQIEKDLEDAESLISDDYVRSGVADPNAVVNKWVIKALLARVYLYDASFSGDDAAKFQTAADYATEVIESGKYRMWTADEYSTVWGNDVGSGEVIFEVYQVQANYYDAYWEAPTHMTNPGGYADVCASKSLVEFIQQDPNDVRGFTGIRDVDQEGAMFCTDAEQLSGGELWPMKYPGKGNSTDISGTPDNNNSIVLRLSEMYLIRSEAQLHGAVISGTNADSDLNVVRSNRNAAFKAASYQSVWEEYKIEFCFEGHHWFNTARLATCSNHNSYPFAEIVYGTDEVTRRGRDGIAQDSHFWALPISRSEMDANVSLVQNPGY